MAITFAEAKEKALGIDEEFNTCHEYQQAYLFFKADEEREGDAGVVILKETGEAINFVTFIRTFHPERNPKKIPL